MQESRLPLAKSVRWRRFRSQTVPILTFLASLVAVNWMWISSGGVVQAVGEVNDLRVAVTAPTMGRVVALPHPTHGQWSLYDQVRAGDVIAHLEGQEPGQVIDVTAPISGTIVELTCWPGQTVIPGAVIATIAAEHSSQVIGYIPENSQLVVRPGMEVTLRPRNPGAKQYLSEVERVGLQIERVPRHQRTVESIAQWGTPVRIKVPDEALLKPGALVDLRFERVE